MMLRGTSIVLALCVASALAANKVNDWSGDTPVFGTATAAECEGDVFPDKITTKFANFDVEYKGSYKVVTNSVPGDEKKYVLYQRGCTQPTSETGVDEYFEVPLTSTWVSSSTIFNVMEYIGERRAIRVTDGLYSSSPCMHQQGNEGYTLGSGFTINATTFEWGYLRWNQDTQQWCGAPWGGDCKVVAEAYEALNLDGVFNWDYLGNSLSNNIPHEIRMSDTKENTYLKISEWNMYIAAFFNREKEIENFHTDMRARFVCISDAAEAPATKKKVLYLDHLWEDTSAEYPSKFKVPTCDSSKANYRHCELLLAAKTEPLNENVQELIAMNPEQYAPSSSGEIQGINAEDLVAWAKDAEVVIFGQTWCPWKDTDDYTTYCANEFNKMLTQLSGIKAVQDKQIFDVGRTMDPLGGSGFYEGAHLEPDVLLEDVIKVVYPEVAPDHELVWLRNMQDEGHGNSHSCDDHPERPGCIPDAAELAAMCVHSDTHQLVNDGCPIDVDPSAAARTAGSLIASALLAVAAAFFAMA